MISLVKMEWYKLRTSKLFIVMLSIVFGLQLLITAGAPLVARALSPALIPGASDLSALISSPFSAGLMLLAVYISAVSFLYSDFAGGYVKNIAGQMDDRGRMVIAKFIVIAIHNLIFCCVGVLGTVLGTLATGQIAFDANILGGVMTLLLKWLLMLALSSVLIFLTVGLKNKTISVIAAVIFATNTLSLLYMGINALCSNVLKLEGVDVGNFMPDALMGSVNAIDGTMVINTVIVSAVFIALFITLTTITFKKRDVK